MRVKGIIVTIINIIVIVLIFNIGISIVIN